MADTLRSDNCFHPETKEEGLAAGFWWVGGQPTAPMYFAVLLGRTRRGASKVVEFKAPGVAGIVKRMEDAGWIPPEPAEIARLCESAGSSQHIVRNRHFISEAKAYADV